MLRFLVLRVTQLAGRGECAPNERACPDAPGPALPVSTPRAGMGTIWWLFMIPGLKAPKHVSPGQRPG
jgi:hypothetical protein